MVTYSGKELGDCSRKSRIEYLTVFLSACWI